MMEIEWKEIMPQGEFTSRGKLRKVKKPFLVPGTVPQIVAPAFSIPEDENTIGEYVERILKFEKKSYTATTGKRYSAIIVSHLRQQIKAEWNYPIHDPLTPEARERIDGIVSARSDFFYVAPTAAEVAEPEIPTPDPEPMETAPEIPEPVVDATEETEEPEPEPEPTPAPEPPVSLEPEPPAPAVEPELVTMEDPSRPEPKKLLWEPESFGILSVFYN